MNSRSIIVVIAGAALLTYLTRFPLMILSGKKKIPSWLEKYMSFVAPAVLTALIVPAIFGRNNKLDFSLSNEYIFAAVLTAIIAYFTKNVLAAVITGVCSVAIVMFVF